MERRAYPRVKWRFVVKFRGISSEDQNWEFSTLNNISLGGCSFSSSRVFKTGEVLELQIKFPVSRDFLAFRGEVKRCEEIKGECGYRIAVSFLEVEEEKKELLSMTVEIARRKGQA